VDNWGKVEFASDRFNPPVISTLSANVYINVGLGIRDVTVDACVPRAGKFILSFLLISSTLVDNIWTTRILYYLLDMLNDYHKRYVQDSLPQLYVITCTCVQKHDQFFRMIVGLVSGLTFCVCYTCFLNYGELFVLRIVFLYFFFMSTFRWVLWLWLSVPVQSMALIERLFRNDRVSIHLRKG